MDLKKIKYPFLIDGGLSNVLEAQGKDLNHNLWSAQLIKTDPNAIIKAHKSYLQAGAECIITSSYQATIQGYLSLGEDRDKAGFYIEQAVELACEAIHQFKAENSIDKNIYVAASIGPYGAYLADGSEYSGTYNISQEELVNFHLKKFDILNTSKADFLAFETIPSLKETKALIQLIEKALKPCWLSFSCRDEDHLNDGNKVYQAAEIAATNPKVFAIGINCTAPKYINGLIKNIKSAAPDKKIIVYPNSGETYLVKNKSWKGKSSPKAFQKMAMEWIENGADIIGGCCRVGPEHIRELDSLLKK